MIYVELLFPGDTQWSSVTELVQAESYSTSLQIMNADYESVVDTVSFSLVYNQLILSKLLAVQPKEKILLRCFDDAQQPCFTGYIASTIKHETADIPEAISLEGRDNSWRLDKPITADIRIPSSIGEPGSSVVSCFTQIVIAAGYTQDAIDPGCIAAPEVVRSIYEQAGDITYRALLNSLLRDYGYVLRTTAEGKLTLYKWHDTSAILQGTVSGNISVTEPFSLRKSDMEHDGIKLIWGKPAVLEDVCLYKAQLPVGSDGIPSGVIIPAGGYYPADGDVVASWQSYKQDWLDRPFLSKTKRTKNTDISLIAAENQYLVIVIDEGITTSETFEPKQAKALFGNPTAEEKKLYVFEIWGKALFREQICETVLPVTAVDPQRIVTDFIFTEPDALTLANGLYTFQQFGDIGYSFTLYQRLYEPGNRIHISQMHPYLDTDAVITELKFTDDVPGFRYTAVGISEFGSLQAVTNAYAASKLGEKGEKGDAATTVEIISHHGTIFRPTVVDTTLEAKVYKDGRDITSFFIDADFRWIRASEDAGGDAVWNSAHFSIGGKTLQITDSDVYGRAVFFCELLTKR